MAVQRTWRRSGERVFSTRPAPRLSLPLLLLLCFAGGGLQEGPACVDAWNSFVGQSQIYSFQDFYTDAQYGPDFGYYSTGRILQTDGPADNGVDDAIGGQNWFNSYTTIPMSLSPDFANALCDRMVTMWHSMGRPAPIIVAEFGGGTGMLARDVLRRLRDWHGDFYDALALYIIAERSPALRTAQSHTAAEFVANGKLQVARADARQASAIRPVFEAAIGADKATVGFVLSNELLDEFDPVRLRLMWHAGNMPTAKSCAECSSYREAHVIHRIDASALQALLEATSVESESIVTGGGGTVDATMEEIRWEGHSLHCGLLATAALRRITMAVAEDLTPAELKLCAPMLVCCSPFLLAVSQALQYNFEAVHLPRVLRRHPMHKGSKELLHLYRHHLQRTNGTISLSKERYRQVRRLASSLGSEVERTLLAGGAPWILPGQMHSDEVFLALRPARCAELQGWMRRNADRLAVASRLRNGVNWIFGAADGMTAMHLKLVVRPGEASFVEQAALLLDEGFMLTLDYGADADALVWQALIRPHHEGIHIMDARQDLIQECTENSYLACPGLQDLTTSVDFTEVAVAGQEFGNWQVLAYGPIFLLELSFLDTSVQLADPGEPERLGHLLERAHGVRHPGLQAWYSKPEQDPWASFKLLVQHRGPRTSDWNLGALSLAWAPLHRTPRLFKSPSSCWRQDLTKPPLASLIASHAQQSLAARDVDVGGVNASEAPIMHAELMHQFQVVLVHNDEPLAKVLDSQHVAQREGYTNVHLAALLVDYWHLIRQSDGAPEGPAGIVERMEEVRAIARSRRLPEVFDEDAFERVFGDIRALLQNASSISSSQPRPPYVCLAELMLLHGADLYTSRVSQFDEMQTDKLEDGDPPEDGNADGTNPTSSSSAAAAATAAAAAAALHGPRTLPGKARLGQSVAAQ